MRLDCVTITGIDDGVDLSVIDDLSARFDFVEWGVLLSTDRKGTPRYPSDRWLAELTNTFFGKYDNSFAAHLCGSLCERFVETSGETYLTGELIEFSKPRFFSRIQINSYPRWTPVQINALASRLLGYADLIVPIPTDDVLERAKQTFLENVEFLYDRSRGRGIVPIEWPRIEINGPVGFAGGISPDNVREALDTLTARPEDRFFWIDMESGVRIDDRFDPERVESVLTIAKDYL